MRVLTETQIDEIQRRLERRVKDFLSAALRDISDLVADSESLSEERINLNDFDTRTRGILWRSGLQTYGEMIEIGSDGLLSLRGVGVQSVGAIKAILESKGFALPKGRYDSWKKKRCEGCYDVFLLRDMKNLTTDPRWPPVYRCEDCAKL